MKYVYAHYMQLTDLDIQFLLTYFSVFGDQFSIRIEYSAGIVQFVPITFWYTTCMAMADIYSTMGVNTHCKLQP